MLGSNWTKMMLSSALALGLFAAPAVAAELRDWDKNADAGLDMSEYRAGLEGAGVFDKWDTDKDKALSQSEFDAGIADNRDAFNARFGENAYSEWDADDNNMLSEDEFYTGGYSAYDDDGNKIIEEPEFGDLGDDIGDAGFWDV